MFWRLLLVVAGLVIAALLALLFVPAQRISVPATPPPPPDDHSPLIDPSGHTIEMLCAPYTEQVYVLLHGVTNSPEQFRAFGELLHAKGANVIIPRMPFHGYTNRLTDGLKGFTAQVMLNEVNRTIDRAKTLGQHITVIGLSVNGVSAAWVAENRPDVETSMVIAPFLAPRGVPEAFAAPLARLFYRLPNFFVWWDPTQKDAVGRGTLTQPRFSTHSMASIMLLGQQLLQAAGHPIAVKRVIVVTSAADAAIDLKAAETLAAQWKATSPGRVQTYQFPSSDNVPHDCIDPRQKDQQTAIVYPQLLKLLASAPGTAPQ